MEPGVGIEPTTYALQVRSLWRQVESRRDTSATVKGFVWFTGTRWSRAEASGLTTELTTLGDIQLKAVRMRRLSLLRGIQPQNSLMIYMAPVPHFFGSFTISCATAVPESSIILSDTWTNTPASLSGLPPQSSAKWTCWPVFVTGPVAKSFGKRLSSTLQHDSNLLKPKMPLDIDEYLLGGFLNSCW